MNTVYKIALVGDTCVGKTALMEKITNGDFILHYEPNNDAVTILDVATNQEPITFSIWEFNTNSSLETLQYFDAAIIMTSANDKKSFENIPYWIRVIEENNSKIPITVCINKSDLKIQVPYTLDKKYACFSVSTKNNDNIRSPFVYLAKKLLENTDLYVY
jgi:GTPase SAR1 family protein